MRKYAKWITANFLFFVSSTCICLFLNVFRRTTIMFVHPSSDIYRCNVTVLNTFVNGTKIWNNMLYNYCHALYCVSFSPETHRRFHHASLSEFFAIPYSRCSPYSVIPSPVRWQPYHSPVSTCRSHVLVHPGNVFGSTLQNSSYLFILFII